MKLSKHQLSRSAILKSTEYPYLFFERVSGQTTVAEVPSMEGFICKRKSTLTPEGSKIKFADFYVKFFLP